MESWCRIIVDGEPRPGLRQGESILLHKGSLFGKPEPTGRQVGIDKAEWLVPIEPRQFPGLWNNLNEAMQKAGEADTASYIEIVAGKYDYPASVTLFHTLIPKLYGI